VRERTLVEVALARLDEAALLVMRSGATLEERHEILGCLVGAHSLLSALARVEPAAVEELLARAIRLARQVSRPRHETAGTPAGRLKGVGPASPATSITDQADVEVPHAVGV
jgi:hypothetical protein